MRLTIMALVFLLMDLNLAFAETVVNAFDTKIKPLLIKHCTSCHSGEKPKAKLDLSSVVNLEQLQLQGQHWFQVLERVEAGSMPPEGKTKLTSTEKKVLAEWVRGEFSDLLLGVQQKEGRSKVRRLTRLEYANTVQDMFGIRPPVVRNLPADGRVDGFDKVGTALPFSSAHAAGYLKLAEDLLARFPLRSPLEKRGTVYQLWSAASEQSKGHILELPDDWHVSFNTDTTSVPLRKEMGPDKKRTGFPSVGKPGWYKIQMNVYAYQTDKPIPFGIYAGHTGAYPQILDLLKVLEAPPGKPTILETEVYLRTGRDSDGPSDDGVRLIPFGLGVQVPKNTQAAGCKGPGLAVQWVKLIESELPPVGDEFLFELMEAEFRTAFISPNITIKNTKLSRKEIEAVAQKTLTKIGSRSFRRDLSEIEVSLLMSNFNSKLDSGNSLKTAFFGEIIGLMTAPDFLCILEQPGKLSDFALASRLSFFLWNSAPDEELLDLARKGKLSDSLVLKQQTERLLKNPKSQRFTKDFVDQWLGLWGIDNTTPDRDLYPDYDDLLKISSVMETQETFRKMLDKNLTVLDFVAPKWAIINSSLAKHYGFSPVEGFALKEISLPKDSPFGGFWTQAATMKVTANGTGTSPVKRGVWFAERLLGVTIPPPPPNIEPIDPDTRGAKTLREQLALHSSRGSCKACHARFDPYGFALESFDVTGAFRVNYREVDPDAAKQKKKWRDGLPVDSTGSTPDGIAFKGIQDLRSQLVKNPQSLAQGITRHLITYATGTPSGPLDQRTIEQICGQAKMDDYGIRSLVHGVVQSELFRSK